LFRRYLAQVQQQGEELLVLQVLLQRELQQRELQQRELQQRELLAQVLQ
jgi:hypothetical protein